MTKRLAILCVLVMASAPAWAAKRMTVEQLQQAIAAAHESHKTDDAMVKQLAEVEVATRMSSATLDQLTAISPGPKTSQLLRALADASVFQDPPASEIPATPAPTQDAQKQMLEATIHYVARTMPSLPNFVATRETAHFDDSEQVLVAGDWPVKAGLHLVGVSKMPLAFRDGKESDDPSLTNVKGSKDKSPVHDGGKGLFSWGEFGQILGIVLVDAAKGKMEWERWEMLDGRQVGVFKFGVDRTISHYNVEYCCVSQSEVVNGSYGGNMGPRGMTGGNGLGATTGIVKSTDAVVVHQITGYHGELTIDPASGTILRITLALDSKPDAPLQHGAMMVEYGTVAIGTAKYIVPTRSVSISMSNTHYDSGLVSQVKAPQTLMLNEVAFSGYHHFGSNSTLVANLPPGTEPAGGTGGAVTAATAPTADAPNATEETTETASAALPAGLGSASGPDTSARKDVVTETAAEEDAEILVRAVNEMPGLSDETSVAGGDPAAVAKANNFTLKANTRLVNVGLVATDKHGKPITDLKLDEIEVYDNGRKQQLRQFRQPATGDNSVKAAAATEPEITFTNTSPTMQTVENVPDMLILLLDEAHIGFQDLTRARQEVLRFLAASRPTSRVALYSIGEHGFHVIQDVTQDHTLLSNKLSAWMPSAASVSQAQQLDKRNYQQFDTVNSARDLNSVNGNFTDTADTFQTSDPQLRQLGDNPIRQAIESMIALSRHFSTVTGHKSLVWISGDSALVDWSDRSLQMERNSKQLDAMFNRAKEELNEAHIALYAVDASQILGGQVDASLENRNVELSQTAKDTAGLQGAGTPRDATAGRVAGQMQTDTRGIQGPVRQLAEATGGRAVNRGSEINKTLSGIESDSLALYEVGFDPDTQPDDKFHTLQLKIPTRKDVKLRYRTEYLYTTQLASTKERFQQAVWSPQDATAVGLTAEAVPAVDPSSATVAGSGTVKLRIAFKGLDLEPEPGGHWGDKLYIFVAQRDDATQKAEVSGDTVKLSLKSETYDSGMPAGIPYHRDVKVKSRLGSVRVIVVDGNSGKMGSVTLPASSLHGGK